MSNGIFTLKYITSKNCFCYLSEQKSKYLNDGVTLKLSYSNYKIAYLSPQSLPGLKENEIGINRLQAQALELQENDSILVNICQHVPGIRRLTISPASKDDYEILELLAENVESTLLNQIRVVYANQIFIIWISDSLHVAVKIDAVDPVTPGRLDNLTEVVIAQPNVGIPQDFSDNSENNATGRFNNLLSYFRKKIPNKNELNGRVLRKFFNSNHLFCFIVHPFEDLTSYSSNSEKLQCFNVFVHKEHLPENFPITDTSNDVFILKIIEPPVTNNNFLDENIVSVKIIAVRLCILNNNLGTNKYFGRVIYVHKSIFKHFALKVGAKAILDNPVRIFPSVNKIEISTTKENFKKAEEKFKQFVSLNCQHEKEKLLLNSEFVLTSDPEFWFSLKFGPVSTNFCIVDPDFIRNCKFAVSDSELCVESSVSVNKDSNCDFINNFGNVKLIIDESEFLLKIGVLASNCEPENVLIVGKSGTGKSTLTKILSDTLFSSPFYIHSEMISCKNIKGKSLESLHKVFSTKILNLVYYQPSVLILDDLHISCEKVNEGDSLTQDSLHFNRVSEMLADLLGNLKHHKIAILATSESEITLNQYIFASRGQHLFKNVFNINELTKDDRTLLLEILFKQKCELENVNMEEFSIKTEGFVVQDLVDFVDKAVFESLKEEKPKVETRHCELSLKNTTALSLKDVQLHSPGDKNFSDVGGLEDVKKILVECMMWPVQYPNLFGHAPLRLQSGLLLYGPPGTGKTILAGAAAKHCGLRLISIKGPELLSKYIGASEQAVRNVFEKAQSAKPCILFFDEFDSLAPRRGHDSTGVTDRVVNQLLTQLDGIESLNGVCVLAATSRPDLLDPALLRPGRLDRQILCPLPNKEARFKILKSLSKKMVLAAKVDLLKLAERTNGYSGADLQSLLYTAQLSAVERLLERPKANADEVAEINQIHLEEALKNTRPSLTKEENFKYKRIYSRFQQGSDIVDIKSGVQRATLA